MTIIHDPQPLTPLRRSTHTTDRSVLSDDGQWLFELNCDGLYRRHGLPLTREWRIQHVPTGEFADRARSLTAARTLTADGSAAKAVLYMAQRKAAGVYGPALIARAKVVLSILAGTIAPAGAEESRCVCGGYLTRRARTWLHVDTCPEEVHDTRPCPDDRATHRFCQQPEPVQCDHAKCHRANDVNAVGCETGHDYCCGCCSGPF